MDHQDPLHKRLLLRGGGLEDLEEAPAAADRERVVPRARGEQDPPDLRAPGRSPKATNERTCDTAEGHGGKQDPPDLRSPTHQRTNRSQSGLPANAHAVLRAKKRPTARLVDRLGELVQLPRVPDRVLVDGEAIKPIIPPPPDPNVSHQS